MPRITKVAWWCGMCGTKNSPYNRECTKCTQKLHEKCAAVHPSERAVVYYNPATGEHRTPPRADMPMPAHYAAEGFERREILQMTAYEKETGMVHEASNFNPGNEGELLDPRENFTPAPEVKKALVEDMAAAFASGPWTGGL